MLIDFPLYYSFYFFPSSIFHIRGSNYQVLYFLKFAIFSLDHKSGKCLLLNILKIQKSMKEIKIAHNQW